MLLMVVQVEPFVEYCQLITLPVCPFKFNSVLFSPEHTVLLLTTCPGTVGGETATVIVSFKLAQPFISLTVIMPPEFPAVTLMIFVPAPELMVQPAGTVQLYVPPANDGIEYIKLF